MTRTLLMFVLAAGCVPNGPALHAFIDRAEVAIDPARPDERAGIHVEATLFITRGADYAVVHGGWLAGDNYTPVARFAFDGRPIETRLDARDPTMEVELTRFAVTNGELSHLCGLQLNLGLTVSGELSEKRSSSAAYPVLVDCP